MSVVDFTSMPLRRRRALPRVDHRVPTPSHLLVTRFARWLEALLVEKNETQLGFASRSGVSQAYLHGILQRGRLPEFPMAERIAAAFNRPADDAIAIVILDRITRELDRMPASLRQRPEFRAMRRILETKRSA